MQSSKASPPRQPKSWRDVLAIHPAAELFPRMSPDELRIIGEDILERGLTSPIVLWRATPDGQAFLLDGRNRLDSVETTIGHHVEVVAEDDGWIIDAGVWISDKVIVLDNAVDPYVYVISANIHRRHLTADQKRELIAALLKADPSKSDRQIAATVKASPTFVGKVRAEKEATGDVSTVDTRRDSRGRNQPAKKAVTRKKATDPPPKVSEEMLQKREEAAERIRALVGRSTRDDVGPGSSGEGIDADTPMLGILLKAWDQAPEPVRQKFMARVGLIPDPLTIVPPVPDLTPIKQRILDAVKRRPGISAEQLRAIVWDDPSGGPECRHTIFVHISQLNRSLALHGLTSRRLSNSRCAMTLGSHQRTVGLSQNHITPRWIVDALGPFDLDPCAADPRPWDCAEINWTAHGLDRDWFGFIYLNPPFNRYEVGDWIARLAKHGNGITLLHARTEAEWFEPIWQHAAAILFIANRIYFCRADGSRQPANSGAPSILAAFGDEAVLRLHRCGIAGALVTRWHNQPSSLQKSGRRVA